MKNIILALLLVAILSSCEEIVENPNLPYKEQLVILGVLKAGLPIDNISITRTLPPLEEFDLDKSLVRNLDTMKDSEAYILSDEVKYPLIYDGISKYFVEDLIPEVGKKYSLYIKWKNNVVTSSTIIPDTVDLSSFSFKKETRKNYMDYVEEIITLYAHFIPKNDAVYQGYTFNPNDPYRYTSDNLYRSADTNKLGFIKLQVTQWYGDRLDTNDFKEYLQNEHCILESYDYQYYYYFKTRYEGNEPDFFSTSGLNIHGNINNGIGLFIGKSESSKKVFF